MKKKFADVKSSLDTNMTNLQTIKYLTGKEKSGAIYERFIKSTEFEKEFTFHAFIYDQGGDPILDTEYSHFYRMLALYIFWQNKNNYVNLKLTDKMKHNDYYALGISLAELFNLYIPIPSLPSSYKFIEKKDIGKGDK